MQKKILSVILAALMIITMIPMTVNAAPIPGGVTKYEDGYIYLNQSDTQDLLELLYFGENVSTIKTAIEFMTATTWAGLINLFADYALDLFLPDLFPKAEKIEEACNGNGVIIKLSIPITVASQPGTPQPPPMPLIKTYASARVSQANIVDINVIVNQSVSAIKKINVTRVTIQFENDPKEYEFTKNGKTTNQWDYVLNKNNLKSGTVNATIQVYDGDKRVATQNRRFTGSGSQSITTSNSLSVKTTENGNYTITVPANLIVNCYSSPTATSSSTIISARSIAYTISATQKLTMSDGSVRYFFKSGDNPPKDLYFVYTSSMSVVYTTTVISKPTITPKKEEATLTPAKSPVVIKGALAYVTVEKGQSIEFTNVSSSEWPTVYGNDSNKCDLVIYNSNGSQGTVAPNTSGGFGLIMGGKAVVTAISENIEFYFGAELLDKIIKVKETTTKAIHYVTVKSGQTIEFTNVTSTEWPGVSKKGDNEYTLVIYNSNGSQGTVAPNATGGFGLIMGGRAVVTATGENLEFYFGAELLDKVIKVKRL